MKGEAGDSPLILKIYKSCQKIFLVWEIFTICRKSNLPNGIAVYVRNLIYCFPLGVMQHNNSSIYIEDDVDVISRSRSRSRLTVHMYVGFLTLKQELKKKKNIPHLTFI